MTGPGYFRRVNTRRNRWRFTALILILIGIWWVVPSDYGGYRRPHGGEGNAASSTKAAPEMPGMEMPGMEMPGMAGMAGMGGTAGEISVTSDQRARYGITMGVVSLRPLMLETRTAGVVTIDETRIAQFAPKVSGVVEQLFVNSTGQPVRRGQPLLQIYSPELLNAQQELVLAGSLQRELGRTQIPGVPAGASNLVEAAKLRLRLAGISDGEIMAIQRTGRPRRTLTLYSPASGTVTEKRVVRGQAVSAGEMLYSIVDLSQVWVEVQLRESEAAAVHNGSIAYLTFAGIPGREVTGRVTYVYPTLDSAARAIRARVVLPNPGGSLKPGMYATVRIATMTRSALVIPSAAVLRTGEREIVFIELPNGNFAAREVRTGVTSAGYAEILSGVSNGQRVATSAQFLLDSESNLGEIMKAMIGQGPASNADDMAGMDMQDKGARVVPGRK